MKLTQNQMVIAGAIAAVAIVSLAYFAYDPGSSLQYPKDAVAGDSEKKIDALTEALEQGKITAVQYRAQVAALAQTSTEPSEASSPPASSAPNAAADKNAAAKFDALNSALDSGLITQDEYNAKVAALTGAAASPPQQPVQAAQGTFQSFDNPGGGRIIAGVLGNQASLQSAMADLLRRVHAEFGGRPNVTQAASNPQGNAIALFFSASKNGNPISGMALVNAAPGAQAGGVVIYDTAQRFPATAGPMMKRLQAMTAPQSSGAAAAPPEPLEQHEFSDGTGSIGVPADWKLTSAGGGSASVLGPAGEFIGYNLDVGATDPNNQLEQNFLRGLTPQLRQSFTQRTVMIAPISDPAQALRDVFRQRAQQNGNTPPAFNVKSVTPMPSSQGYNAAEIVGTATIPHIPGKSDDEPGAFVAFVQVTPPNNMGQWNLFDTMVFVPDSQFGRHGATAAAIMESIRINFGAVAAQGEAMRNMFQHQFNAMIASAREQDAVRQEGTDRAMALDRATQEGMHRQAVAMENFSLDRSVVVNNRTGVHSTVGNDFADALTSIDPDYRTVPANQLLRGVDY